MSFAVFSNFAVLILDSLALLFQILAAWVGYSIYKFNRLSKGWIAIIFGFLLQVVRRIVQLYSDYQGWVLNASLDRALMFMISLLIFVGLWSMLKNFENFDIVSESTSKKIKRVGKNDF